MAKFFMALLLLMTSSLSIAAVNPQDEAAFTQKLNSITTKPYHHSLEATGRDTSCQLCHGTSKPVAAPDDKSCLSCHGTRDQIAGLTQPDPKDKDAEPNPHDSMHYGKDVPCTACHNEHKPSVIYCNSCHLFKYPDMKP